VTRYDIFLHHGSKRQVNLQMDFVFSDSAENRPGFPK